MNALLVRFLAGGPGGFGSSAQSGGGSAATGVALSVLSATLLLLEVSVGEVTETLPVILGTAACGVLYLIPLSHILLELKLRKPVPHAA